MRLYARMQRLGAAVLLWLALAAPASAQNPTAAPAKIIGLEPSLLYACLASGELADGVFCMRQQGADAGVRSTPTYIVNGTMYPGRYSIKEFSEIIDPLVADN